VGASLKISFSLNKYNSEKRKNVPIEKLSGYWEAKENVIWF